MPPLVDRCERGGALMFLLWQRHSMKKNLILLFSIFCLVNTSLAQTKKVLIVSTNVDTIQDAPNGTFLMEIAYPLAAFTKAGIEADVVTPKGGKAAIYHTNTLPDSLAAIQQSEMFIDKTTHSLAPDQVVAFDYSGIFYPGGGGQFYDVVNNENIAKIAARIYENRGIVGSAGHGPVSLINIKLSDGTFLVNNKDIACFPKYASAKWLPIDWEVELTKRGAKIVLPLTAVEKDKGVQLLDKKNRIISGSFAENAEWVAEQMAILIREPDSQR